MIRVNLLAPERPTKTKKARSVSVAPGAVQVYLFLALFAGGALVLCAALWWYETAKIKKLDADIATAEQRQRELQAIKVQVDALEAKRRTFQQKVDLIERLKAAQSEPVHLLDEIERHFGVKLLWFEKLPSPGYRDDVTTHSFFDTEDTLTDDLKLEIRRWLEGQGWQFSRQMVRVLGDEANRVEHVYLAPMIPVTLEVGYHGTRRISVSSIMERGLLPSVPEWQTTEKRWDCEGNIFLCEKLGTSADAGVPRYHAARLSSSHSWASVVLPYPAGATSRMIRAPLSSSIRVSRGLLMIRRRLTASRYRTGC